MDRARLGGSCSVSSTTTLNVVLIGPTATRTVARYLLGSVTSMPWQPGRQAPTCSGSVMNCHTRSTGAATRKLSSIFMLRTRSLSAWEVVPTAIEPMRAPARAGADRSTGLPSHPQLLVREPVVVEDHVAVEDDRAIAHRHVVVGLGHIW